MICSVRDEDSFSEVIALPKLHLHIHLITLLYTVKHKRQHEWACNSFYLTPLCFQTVASPRGYYKVQNTARNALHWLFIEKQQHTIKSHPLKGG